MEHKKLSRYLLAAGIIAGAGAGGIFLIYLLAMISVAIDPASPYAYLAFAAMVGMIAMAILYGLALKEYFCICLRIGKNRSFCPENAKGLHRIFQFFLSAALLWLAAEFSAFLPGMAWGSWNIAFLLFAMASAAMGILAYALGKLLKRATQLQEENELTI